MAAILPQIPQQGFEKVRNRIGEIITEEIANQLILAGVPPTFRHEVFVERFARIDRAEGLVLNVTFVKGDLQNEDISSSQFLYTFNVDAYIGAKWNANVRGDTGGAISLQTVLGWVRAIIRDTRYKTLAFQPPFVLRRTVPLIQVATPDQFKDTLATQMGRVTVEVLLSETEGEPTPLNIGGWITNVKLYETDLGYVFTEFPDPNP